MSKFWEESYDLHSLGMSTPSMNGFLRDVAGMVHRLEVSRGENVAPSLIIEGISTMVNCLKLELEENLFFKKFKNG